MFRSLPFRPAPWWIAAACALIPVSAFAQLPAAATSVVPTTIRHVGQTAGIPDPAGTMTIVVNDAASLPVPGAQVWLDYLPCDVRFCFAQPPPLLTTNCAAGILNLGVTNAAGMVTFRVLGYSVAPPCPSPGCAGPSVAVFAQIPGTPPVQLRLVDACAFDLNAAGGVNAADFSQFMCTFFGPYSRRIDYNGSGTVSAADLAIFISVLFGGGSLASGPAAFCP